jgi:hypothetical protein
LSFFAAFRPTGCQSVFKWPNGNFAVQGMVGDHFQEALLLRIAAAYETETKFSSKRPPVFFAG